MLIGLLAFFGLSLGFQALGKGLNLRPDLNDLGTFPCQNADTYEFWKKGIFDSQISVAIYEFKNTIKEGAARALAEKSALVKKHRGFGFGRCDEASYYIITTPSPVNHSEVKLGRDSKGDLKQDLEKKLKENCLSYQIDVTTESHTSAPQSLPLRPLPRQGVSVTCFLDNTSQEWFLIPPMNLNKSNDKPDLFTWINLKRSELKLPNLSLSEDLNLVAKELNQKNTPLHDRKALEKALMGLRKITSFKNTKFLFEDRASGKSLGEIKDLLWWSPRHRDLLLKPSGKSIGINQKAPLQISLVITD